MILSSFCAAGTIYETYRYKGWSNGTGHIFRPYFSQFLCEAQCSVDSALVGGVQIDEGEGFYSGSVILVTLHCHFHKATL